MTVWRTRQDAQWRNDVAEGPERGTTSVRDSDDAADGAGHLTTLAERASSIGIGRDRKSGLVTRCVLLLLYAGLLRHQNVKCAREACTRVGTPPLHFYRWLPVKPADISRFLAPNSVPVRLYRSPFSFLRCPVFFTRLWTLDDFICHRCSFAFTALYPCFSHLRLLFRLELHVMRARWPWVSERTEIRYGFDLLNVR